MILAALLIAYLTSEWIGIPVSIIAGAAAIVFQILARQSREIHTWKIVKGAPWAVVVFSIGMYVVVYGLRNVGLTDGLGHVFKWIGDQGLVPCDRRFLVCCGSSLLYDEQHADGHDQRLGHRRHESARHSAGGVHLCQCDRL
ncbi:arsenical pump membrane family protein [Paenibacillus macerans]|uniref:Arsenical pump membrane family protein n=1 Tax=Paenibacillus macerans TaxID=44252 RepID=A0A090ZKN5_PAEMA|nr:arsenical pump membrane family protein [Paenibacillus macerans]